MTKMIDLTGTHIGRLAVVRRVRLEAPRVYWLCECECGELCEVSTTHLRSAHTTSCGCVMREVTAARNRANAKHGMSDSVEYRAWRKMIDRCENQKNRKFPDYGGRGIRVCAEWKASFDSFYDHVGARPSADHSLDRIRNHLGYEPGNVRWAVLETQNNNKRTNVIVTIGGVSKTVAQWSRESGLSHRTISYRVKAGWPADAILSESRR